MRLLITTFIPFCFTTLFSQIKPSFAYSCEVITDGIKYYEDNKYDKAINEFKKVAESYLNK